MLFYVHECKINYYSFVGEEGTKIYDNGMKTAR